MNSLQELNSYGNTTVSYTDTRPAGIRFDRVNTQNQTVTINQHDTHGARVGIEIIEVIDPTTSAPSYTVNVSTVTGATVSWPTVPGGCTVTNPSTGVYTISGVNSKAIWDIVKNPTITLAAVYVGTGSYTSTITYNTSQTKTWTTALTVIDITNMDTADDFYFYGGTSGVITGNPVVIDNYPTTWNVTVTPSTASLITSLSSAGSGGTSSFDSGTKVLTITGTKTQVNSHLNSITYVIPSTTKQDFTLTYSADNVALSEGDSKVQQMYTTEYLTATRASESYLTNTSAAITNGPGITDYHYEGSAYYTLTVVPSPSIAVSTMSSITRNYYPETSTSPSVIVDPPQAADTTLYFSQPQLFSKDLTYWAAYSDYTSNYPTKIKVFKRTGNSVALDASVSLNAVDGSTRDFWRNCDDTFSTVLVTRPQTQPETTYVKERTGSSWSTTFTVTPDSGNSGWSRGHIINSTGDQFCVVMWYPTSTPGLYPKFYFYAKTAGTWALVNLVTSSAIGVINDSRNATFFSQDGETFFAYNDTSGNYQIYKKTSGTWAFSQNIAATIADSMFSRLLPDGKFAKYNDSALTTSIYSYSSGTWSITETRNIQYPYRSLTISSDLNYYASGGIVYKKGLLAYEKYCYLGTNSTVPLTEEFTYSITNIASTLEPGYSTPNSIPWVYGTAYPAGTVVSYNFQKWRANFNMSDSEGAPDPGRGWSPIVEPLSRYRIEITISGTPTVSFPPIPNGLGMIISGCSNNNYNGGFPLTQVSGNTFKFYWPTLGGDNPGSASNGTIKLYGFEYQEAMSLDANYIIRGSAVGENVLDTIKLYTKTTPDPIVSSWNAGTKTLTLQGTRDEINTMIDGITLTPTTDYAADFSLTYTVTTPNGNTDNRSQDVDHTS